MENRSTPVRGAPRYKSSPFSGGVVCTTVKWLEQQLQAFGNRAVELENVSLYLRVENRQVLPTDGRFGVLAAHGDPDGRREHLALVVVVGLHAASQYRAICRERVFAVALDARGIHADEDAGKRIRLIEERVNTTVVDEVSVPSVLVASRDDAGDHRARELAVRERRKRFGDGVEVDDEVALDRTVVSDVNVRTVQRLLNLEGLGESVFGSSADVRGVKRQNECSVAFHLFDADVGLEERALAVVVVTLFERESRLETGIHLFEEMVEEPVAVPEQ